MLRRLSLYLIVLCSNVLISSANAQQFPFPIVPNPKMTPGSLCNPSTGDFEGYRYKQRVPVCRRNVSHELKAIIYNAYGIPPRCRRNYTIDHFIPLSIGGSNQIENLWPEHRLVKMTRLQFEDEIMMMVRDGQTTQANAVQLVYKIKMNPPINPGKASSSCN
jgi:hypothetical protein